MNAQDHEDLINELHRRQGLMYAGGSIDAVTELLDPEVIWHVPGTSPIAGDHHGINAVVSYFQRRRQLANNTMSMHPGKLVTDGDALAQFVTGEAVLEEETVTWNTLGVYRFSENRVCEVWLVPLDLALFDRLWTPGSKFHRDL